MVKPRSRTLLAVLALLTVAAARPPPNDPHFDQQWGLHRIRAPEAWTISQGEGVVAAVVDSGVDLTHPDLAGALARRADGSVLGYDFVEGDDDPTDEHGHGTMVAGIIAARTSNGTGVASVAPAARIMPVRVLDSRALGPNSTVEEGIRWAVDHGAHVINLSLEVARERWAGTRSSEQPISSLERVLRYAWSRGVAVVAAAGNDSADFTDYPSDSPVVLVGATNERDVRAGFSDAGRPDALMAPGVNIVSTWCSPCGSRVRHRIGRSEGTSYAAAHVTGAIALMRGAGYGSATAVSRLRQTARDVGSYGPDRRTGYGRIDVAAALGLPGPAGGTLKGSDGLVPQQASDALEPGSTRSPPGVLARRGTTGSSAGANEESAAFTRGDASGSARAWGVVAAGLLVSTVAALWWVTVREQLPSRRYGP
ncbi:MAG: S8 family serine peptidase [Actinomycetota bacterium]|nr:S8 family serine peptidase [Actinomycetota bacterium]